MIPFFSGFDKNLKNKISNKKIFIFFDFEWEKYVVSMANMSQVVELASCKRPYMNNKNKCW